MSTTQKKKAPRPEQFTPRQTAALVIAHALVSSAGYEILDVTDGDVADDLGRRATEIADAVLRRSA